MSASDSRRQRRLVRKIKAHEVEHHACRFCQKRIIIWPGKAKVSHETPPCDDFVKAMKSIAEKHGNEAYAGDSYPALLMIRGGKSN